MPIDINNVSQNICNRKMSLLNISVLWTSSDIVHLEMLKRSIISISQLFGNIFNIIIYIFYHDQSLISFFLLIIGLRIRVLTEGFQIDLTMKSVI
jgi:hypothetical protein